MLEAELRYVHRRWLTVLAMAIAYALQVLLHNNVLRSSTPSADGRAYRYPYARAKTNKYVGAS